jgi:hypothetical protein
MQDAGRAEQSTDISEGGGRKKTASTCRRLTRMKRLDGFMQAADVTICGEFKRIRGPVLSWQVLLPNSRAE